MAYYYKLTSSEDVLPPYKGFYLQTVKKLTTSGPNIQYDFSKHVLIELLDDVTPESRLWNEMGLVDNKNIVHKRMTIDSHRIKCRRAIVVCVSSDEANLLAQRLSQTRVVKRCVCAIVVQDLLSDLCLFEKQIIQFGDSRSQHQLLYVSDLSRSRGPSGLTQFLKEKFSPFRTILSVLICSDDDGYAFPEGVIKFAYLSEAFAAELAFDQFVVGKERLSVTTHHNILLSQCDLRIRLREAQWCCNIDNNESSESIFHPYNLDNLEGVNDSVDKSLSNLRISHVHNSENDDDNSGDSVLEDTLPAFSQCNFYKNSSKNYGGTMLYRTKKPCGKKEEITNVVDGNSLQCNNISSADNSHIINFPVQQIDPVPFEMTATHIIDKSQNHKLHSRKNIALDSLLGNSGDKPCKNESDTESFLTCKSQGPNSKLLLSPKTSSYKSFNSRVNESVLEFQTQSSKYSLLSSPLKDSAIVQESLPKQCKKRKKKFTASQKLCLKSQRTALSQGSTPNKNIEVCNSSLSLQKKSQSIHLAPGENLDLNATNGQIKVKSSESSKVADWLLKLPGTNIQDGVLFSNKKDLPSKSIFMQQNKLCQSSISVHRTPALKPNVRSEPRIIYPINYSDENKEPNNMLLVSSDESNSIVVTDKYKSPLQMWLKQELVSSTNNSVFESKENSKSIIVCAVKSKDIIISVGCSHMTCDTCYPESTDLLLGYS